MKQVGIIGNGWVGGAMLKLFPGTPVYDPAYPHSAKRSEINECDVAFICVPTARASAADWLDTSIVAACIQWCEAKLIVIRSTVNPGNCDKWKLEAGKRIVVQPEYLGESPAHPFLDMADRKFLVIGGDPVDRRELIDLYAGVYNANVKIRQVSCLEAEIIKLSENRAIAFKVAQCQELYDVCQRAEVDYYTIRDAVYGDDPRMTLWWTFVYPDRRGMSSKCIPKDVYAWSAWAESIGYDAQITRAILRKNLEWTA